MDQLSNIFLKCDFFALNARPILATFLAKEKLAGLTHSLLVGVPDNIQTFVLYIQTSSRIEHTNPQAQIPPNQML